MYTLYHNNRCGKSRAALAALQEQNSNYVVKDYLNSIPTKEELEALLELLGMSAFELIRKKETIFINQFKDKKLSNNEWLEVLMKYPILIERPIIVSKNKATIARSPEKIAEALAK